MNWSLQNLKHNLDIEEIYKRKDSHRLIVKKIYIILVKSTPHSLMDYIVFY